MYFDFSSIGWRMEMFWLLKLKYWGGSSTFEKLRLRKVKSRNVIHFLDIWCQTKMSAVFIAFLICFNWWNQLKEQFRIELANPNTIKPKQSIHLGQTASLIHDGWALVEGRWGGRVTACFRSTLIRHNSAAGLSWSWKKKQNTCCSNSTSEFLSRQTRRT